MRPRSAEDLNDPARLARVASVLNPANSPAYLREFVRSTLAMDAIDFLAGTMDGSQTFDVVVITNIKGGGQSSEVKEVSAPGAVRVKAAELLLRIAVPPQVGIEGGGEGDLGGVMALGQLALSAAQRIAASGREVIAVETDHPDGLTYVVQEEHMREGDAVRSEQPAPPVEEVVNPDFVAHVLARTRQHGDGVAENPEPEAGNGRH